MFGRKNKHAAVVIEEPLELDAATEEALFMGAMGDLMPAGAGQGALVDGEGRRRLGGLRSRREALVPVVATARERMLPAVASARGRVGPAVAGARGALVDSVAPAVAGAVTTAVSAAREGSLPSRELARERSAAALAALRGEQPESPRRWPLALVSLLAGAAAGVVAGLLARRAAAPGEPTYIPASTPPPSPASTAAQPPAATGTMAESMDAPVATASNLGWPEQLEEPLQGSGKHRLPAEDAGVSGEEPLVITDEVDLTLVEDSSDTHKPTH